MAEFQEVMKQWGRLCSEHCAKYNDDCDGCLLGGTRADVCAAYARDCADAGAEIENLVIQWAAEHPEPVYPTWFEWLASINVIPKVVVPDVVDVLMDIGILTPIPSDIAQKLGIEAKEG